MATDDHEPNGMLDPRDYELARLIAAGLTYAAAGETVGMSMSTVVRRMRHPRMREAVDRARQRSVDAVLAENLPEASRSIRFLARVRDDASMPDYLRVRAAQELLANVSRLGRHVSDPGPMPIDDARAVLLAEAHRIRNERAVT